MNKKLRRTLNISLQSKKYSEPINDIVNNWEEEGSNTSAEVCNLILLQDKYNKSITLSNVKNIFELIQKMIGIYTELDTPESNMLIEEVLSKVIIIDNSKLSVALAELNQRLSNSNKKSKMNYLDPTPEHNNKDLNVNIDNNNSFQNETQSNFTKRKSIQQELLEKDMAEKNENKEINDNSNMIPLDFLSNS